MYSSDFESVGLFAAQINNSHVLFFLHLHLIRILWVLSKNREEEKDGKKIKKNVLKQ